LVLFGQLEPRAAAGGWPEEVLTRTEDGRESEAIAG